MLLRGTPQMARLVHRGQATLASLRTQRLDVLDEPLVPGELQEPQVKPAVRFDVTHIVCAFGRRDDLVRDRAVLALPLDDRGVPGEILHRRHLDE